MFDQYEKGPKPASWIGLKIFAGSIAGLLVSLGLCGVGFRSSQFPAYKSLAGAALTMGTLGFLASGAGLVVGIIWAIVEGIEAATRKNDSR